MSNPATDPSRYSPTDPEAPGPIASVVDKALVKLHERGVSRAQAVHALHRTAHQLDTAPTDDQPPDIPRYRRACAAAFRDTAATLSAHPHSSTSWTADDVAGDRTPPTPPNPPPAVHHDGAGAPPRAPVPNFDMSKYIRKPLPRQYRDRGPAPH